MTLRPSIFQANAKLEGSDRFRAKAASRDFTPGRQRARGE
jgi:hypothetical protein